MQALATLRRFRNLATIVPVLALAACGQGDGPESIPNEPVTPLPPVAPGFCDPINFEPECSNPEIVNFNGGATIIVDNPDPTGINTSDRVAQMQKFPDEVFGGTLLNLEEPIDFSEGESYTVKVWSPRPVTVSLKLEEQGNPAGGLTVDEDHSGSGSWEELCFDFTGQAVPPPVVALTVIFDNGTLGQADTDPDNWTFYYDDITQVESCEAAGGPGDIQPAAALYTSAGAPDLVIPDDYTERTAFGSGSVIDPDYADDDTFSPVLSVFSGTGYGANIAQVGFIGFPEGFLTRYETVDFKVKGMPGFVIFVKLFDGVDALRLNLTSSSYSSELSDGWFQVSIPVADFAGAGEATGIVFESDDSSETEFRMLLNDVGFSGTGTYVPADPGIVPETALYDRDGTPDLVIPDDYAEITVFGSGAVIDDDFTGDLDFSPALAVTTGFGYDIWNAQLAYTGFAPGFATEYETLQFKVKDLSGDIIRVKLLPAPDYLDIDVTTSPYSTSLGNGWYQVAVPVADLQDAATGDGLLFETISPAPAESFTYLITDIGFSGTGAADPGTVPDVVIYSSSASADLEFGVDYTGFEPFGSGSTFDDNVTTDRDFSPVFGVTTGDGYGAQVGQFAIVGFDAGFAVGYESLDFKAKGLNNDIIRVRFLDNGDYLDIVLTNSPFSTDLGNGWYQVSVPMTNFTGVDTATTLLFETDNTAAAAFTFLLTDIGFSGVPGPGDSADSIIPENVIFATDPGVAVDFEFGVDYTGFEPFGSGSVFNSTFADDPDFSPVFAVTSGAGYGANVGQFAIVGFDAGFAAGFATLDFKVKGMPDDIIRIRFLDDGAYVDIDLTTSDYSTALGNGWYQVSIPLTQFTGVDTATALLFESTNTSPDQFTFLLTDFGFSGTPAPPPGGGELLVNGDFEASDADKAPWINAGTVATNTFYTVDAVDGGNVFDTNLSQVLDITQDAEYVLTFRARATVARDIVAGIGLNVGPFTAVTVDVPLTTEWQTFTYNLTASGFGGADSRVLFDMGTVASTINIDDVSLTLASAPGTNLLTNGDFEASAADKAPWINAGAPATNNYYTVDAADGGNVFDTNLSQVLDITQDEDYVLTFRARASVARDIVAGIGLNVGPFTAVTNNVPLTTEWQSFSYDLTATGFGGPDSRVLFDMGTVASTVNIDDASLTVADAGSGGGGGGVDIAVNGGFESGDFTGWTQFEATLGDQTVNADAPGDTSSEGVFHLEINNTASGTNSLIKQERVGLGTVTPGIAWTVTFDARGSFDAGGVAFAQVFSETAGGSENCTGCGILGSAPLGLNPDPAVWTSFSFSGTAGPNTESLTLQLEAVTGGGNLANVFYDNITIVVGDGGG